MMKKTNPDFAKLRLKAEGILDKKIVNDEKSHYEVDTLKLIHELELHQIELEMQNEELILAKVQAAKLATEKYDKLYDYAPSGFFTLSKEGEIHELNLCGSKMLGKERLYLKNSIFGFFVSIETRPIFNFFLEKVFESNKTQTCELVISAIGKAAMHLYLTGITNLNGEQCLVTGVDITERKQAEIALRESDERVKFKLQSFLLPEGSIADLELNDIIDIPTLQKLMENFNELIQISIAIIDKNGKVLVCAGRQDICTKFHRVNPGSCLNCIESDIHLTQGIPDGEFKLYKCKNNMWDMATPLIIGGEHKGDLFLGQFFFDNEFIDYNLFHKQADQYGYAEQEYIAALDKVPRLNQQKLDHAKAFFLNLSHSISQLGYGNIKLARAITQQKLVEQALKKLSEELEERVIERTDQLVRSNSTLRQTEEKYRTVADFTYDWEYWINAEGRFIYVSPSCKRISGYNAVEFIDDPELLSRIIFNADAKIWDRHRIDNPILNSGEKSSEFNIRIVTKTGDIRWICCVYQKIFVDGSFLGIRASNRDITDKINADNELLNITLKVEERERNHFSRELHDGLGPLLSTVKLYFQWLAETNNSEKSKIITEKGNLYIESAIQTTREMAHGLSSLILIHSGYVQTVLNYAKTIQETQKLNVDFKFNSSERFGHLVETTLYRITTELINNTIKYAKASNIEIVLNYQKEIFLITFSYADNGIGFDLANSDKNKNGLGLLNIQHRVDILKGKLQIETSPGNGLKTYIELPVVELINSKD